MVAGGGGCVVPATWQVLSAGIALVSGGLVVRVLLLLAPVKMHGPDLGRLWPGGAAGWCLACPCGSHGLPSPAFPGASIYILAKSVKEDEGVVARCRRNIMFGGLLMARPASGCSCQIWPAGGAAPCAAGGESRGTRVWCLLALVTAVARAGGGWRQWLRRVAVCCTQLGVARFLCA